MKTDGGGTRLLARNGLLTTRAQRQNGRALPGLYRYQGSGSLGGDTRQREGSRVGREHCGCCGRPGPAFQLHPALPAGVSPLSPLPVSAGQPS